jgi:hypothetical protein
MVGRIMNDLFWALYWIDVLGSFPDAFGKAVLSGLVAGLVFLFLFCGINGDFSKPNPQPRSVKQTIVASVLFMMFVVVVSAFIPSKQTMYLMLGVKTTENVMESDMGKKLKSIVDAELDGLLKKYKPKEQK